jgi:Calcineurin-like phosphoesterase
MHAEAPSRIVVAGDWHGNAEHGRRVIAYAAAQLADQPVKIILQLGDFGVWPDAEGVDYIGALLDACHDYDARIWFIDGNHENFDMLPRLAISDSERQRIHWLPRGHRWNWHGREWLAMGGGVSLDKAGPPCLKCYGRGAYARQQCRKCGGLGRFPRIEGINWWPDEEITLPQAEAAIAAGRADVLVSHDCPARVVHAFPDRPWWWAPEDILRQEAHAEILQCIASGTRAARIIHGHLHMGYQRTCDFGYGPVEVTGLDRDPRKDDPVRRRYSYGTLDTIGMKWDIPDTSR